MKAMLCKEFCTPDGLVLEDVAPLKPGAGEIVISVKACGLNFLDGLMIQGKYQTKPPFPFSPGAEVAGVVKALGEGVSGPPVGTRVLAMAGHGGYAEEVAVPASGVFPIPDAMDFTTAASLIITYGTSHHAFKDRAHLQAGETVLVLGAAGGVGLTAVELAKAAGARVIAVASSEEKLALARSRGADELVNYSAGDLREKIRAIAPKGVDVVYDPVGGPYAEPMVRSLAWMGRYLVIGFAAGDIPKIPLNLLLLKSAGLLGVFWGTWARGNPQANAVNTAEIFDMILAGKLKPHVSATFPLERAAEALKVVMERKVLGKVVLEIGR